MKSTSLFFAIIAFTSSSLLYSFHVSQEHEDTFLTACCTPLDFTQPHTIHDFLKNVFSNKRYVYDYLPYNLCNHILPFLQEGKKIQNNARYLESSLRLFYNRMKACPFICPESFIEFLDKAPQFIQESCIACGQTNFYTDIEKNMMDIFVPTFVSQFSLFKTNPETFLKNLSRDVTVMVRNAFNACDHNAQEQLKQMFIRFVELGLAKLVWSPHDQLDVWNSMKKISLQCTTLIEMNLINPDELDDLYKSLIESFCRFLDLAGSDLSPHVIEQMKEEVLSPDLLMFELDEQEQMIETKRERMLYTLMQTEAKIEARKHGIITDVVAC